MKWASNHKETMEDVDKARQVNAYINVVKAGSDLKILGLHVNLEEDCFQYIIKMNQKLAITKR